MELDEITYQTRDDGVAVITLDRPAIRNAISARPGGTRDQILWALRDAGDSPDVGCVVLTGAGSCFSGGGDVTGNARRESPVEDYRFQVAADEFHQGVRSAAVPVIAAVHGYCLGAGLSLAASCDFVVAAKNAVFGFPEGRIGLVGASAVVPTVGRQWAKFLMLTGEQLDADQAREIGLVLTVVPDEELLARCLDLAGRIARMPREATLLNRRSIDAVADAIEGPGRIAATAHDTVTLSMAARATAPDGRTFRQILDTEGMAGLKAARETQYREPWLST